MVHNHPSGDYKPSQDDINTAKLLKSIAKSLDLRFLDSVIIGDSGYYSLFDNDDI